MALNNDFTLIKLFLLYLYLPEMLLISLNGFKLLLLEIRELTPQITVITICTACLSIESILPFVHIL